MRWEVVESYEELSLRAAELLLAALDARPSLVLGLPTGRTPEGMYDRVVALCRRQRHCFAEATSFNLDEYVGIPPEHPASYASYMRRHLFDPIDFPPQRRHVPDGTAREVLERYPDLPLERALALECERYEATLGAAGGLSLTFLGLGRNGHIAFNEPGSPWASRTRVVVLEETTRRANAAGFGNLAEVPKRAITMGVGTILESGAIVLLASGAAKAPVVRRLHDLEASEQLPAAALHRHPEVTVLVDREAASLLPGRASARP
jgi:glucosamine-6-phosphate deaminase